MIFFDDGSSQYPILEYAGGEWEISPYFRQSGLVSWIDGSAPEDVFISQAEIQSVRYTTNCPSCGEVITEDDDLKNKPVNSLLCGNCGEEWEIRGIRNDQQSAPWMFN